MGDTELWVPIKNYEGLYEVSNFGRVKSLARKGNCHKNIILKTLKDRDGYYRTNLSRNSKRKTIPVHQLVANAFVPNAENKPEINHKDGVKTNNFWWNLEWCTNLENIEHASVNGLRAKPKQVAQIKNGKVVGVWASATRASLYFKICKSCIYHCCSGNRKTAGGFQWKYFTS